MKLTKIALQYIKDLSPTIKSRLALALNVSGGAINRYIRENDTCDELTKAAALVVLREMTGLSDDELLENEMATA